MDWPHFLAKYCAPLWVSHSGEEPSLRTGKIKMDEKTYLGDQSKNVGFGAAKLTTCCHKNKKSPQSAMVPMSCGTILMRPFCWLVGMDLICLLDSCWQQQWLLGFHLWVWEWCVVFCGTQRPETATPEHRTPGPCCWVAKLGY